MPKLCAAACSNEARLLGMLGLTGSFMLVELIVGNTTNSMALVADSFHMLSDVIAIIIAYISVRISPKRWKKNTFGWARAEVVGALVNSVFLFALCFSIFVEAIKRFMVVEDLNNPELILIVGGVGLLINVVGMLLFGSHAHSHGGDEEEGAEHSHSHSLTVLDSGATKQGDTEEQDEKERQKKNKKGGSAASGEQMNITGVFLHVMADALGSVAVIISALVIWLTDWEYRNYLDPVLSLVIVLIICASSWPLLRDSTLVLLNTIPSNIDLMDLEKNLIERTEVSSVHELHVWRLVGSRVVASCHLELLPPGPEISPVQHHMEVARQVKEFFHGVGIHSTTIQLEYNNPDTDPGICQLECPTHEAKEGEEEGGVSKDCLESSCCRARPGKGIANPDSTEIAVITQS